MAETKPTKDQWIAAARVELENLWNFIGTDGIVQPGYHWHARKLIERIKQLLAVDAVWPLEPKP